MPIALGILSVFDKQQRCNKVIHRPSDSDSEHTVVFFPGDISDFAFSRSNDPLVVGDQHSGNYTFSLESLAWDICSEIPTSSELVIIKPNMMMGNFSIYSNFLYCDTTGTPRWEDMEKYPDGSPASKSLLEFLENLEIRTGTSSRPRKVTLIGFSKGSVILSAILKERHPELLQLIDEMIFIDPGTCKPESNFPFKCGEYHSFPSDIPIKVYVSPYQMSDPNRPWLKEEILRFVHNSGATLVPVLTGEERSLENHFKAITVSLSLEYG